MSRPSKIIIYIFLVFFVSSARIIFGNDRSENIPIGKFENMSYSSVTGDVGGYSVEIYRDKDKLKGKFVMAAGEESPEQSLYDVACDEKTASCRFSCTVFIPDSCTLVKIKSGAVLFIKNQKSSHLLFDQNVPENNKKNVDPESKPELYFIKGIESIVLSSLDSFSFASGQAWSKNTKSSAKVLIIPEDSKVKLVAFHTESDYMAEIEYQGKILFVDINDFQETYPAAITGERVRFRKIPALDGEIIMEFPKWTIVGFMHEVKPENKWIKITYNGQIGYVSKDFLTGY